jgi:hypothetical protein
MRPAILFYLLFDGGAFDRQPDHTQGVIFEKKKCPVANRAFH